MTPEGSRWCKLTKSVTNHSLNNQHRDKVFSVVNHQRMPDKIRRNLTCTRPGFNWLIFIHLFLLRNFLKQFFVYIWSFFAASTHTYFPGLCFPGFLRVTIYLSEYFLCFRVFPTALRPVYVFGNFNPIPE